MCNTTHRRRPPLQLRSFPVALVVKEPPPHLPATTTAPPPQPTTTPTPTTTTAMPKRRTTQVKPLLPVPANRRGPMPTGRSQHQIRDGLYLKLGLLNNTPQQQAANMAKEQTTEIRNHGLTSCFNKRQRSAIHASEEKRVTFYEQVVVRNIPSHRDLDEETWDRLYHDPEIVKKEMKRNKYEFWVDGGDWRRATEEDEFFQAADGSLVHPASWSVMSNLAWQYRQTFHNKYNNDEWYDYDYEDEDEEEHEEEDPTSVIEVDSPRAVHCPYKNDRYQYGYPHRDRLNNNYIRRRSPMYVSPVQG